MPDMTFEINGEKRSCPPLTNLRELLTYLGVGEDRIAVEVNRHIVRRADWDTTALCDHDSVEIVQFVGGG
jgi:sulfur carrier protein